MSESAELWRRFCQYACIHRRIGFALDVSRIRFDDEFLNRMTPAMDRAFAAMAKLEGGAIANPDEKRMVGHYWLRSPKLAPTEAIQTEIRTTLEQILDFKTGVLGGQIRGDGGPFENLLLVGIGGSALGPQFLAHALANSTNALRPCFLDNTDPDGIDHVLGRLAHQLDRTLVVVISKSGGTPETRNGMLEVKEAYRKADVEFARHAVAITQEGSSLDKAARAEEWRQRFPMWDWVGGRTSVMSAVGLVPASLMGIPIEPFLQGAAEMDELTRHRDVRKNPAALLALAWFHAGNGRGEKDMVVIPYKDRLELFSRYLQQLVMESLGKEKDRRGSVVRQGIAVYGNKGSTDQHAYVQQLRDGVPNFFVTFIDVLRQRESASIDVDPGFTSGDYLHGFLRGTRSALYANGRESITIQIDDVSPRGVGQLIALFERAVGLYAELIDINAYHQPGVQAGKDAANGVLQLQQSALQFLRSAAEPQSATQVAKGIGSPEQVETVYHLLEHLAANPGRGIVSSMATSPEATVFRCED